MMILGIIYTIFPLVSYAALGEKTPEIILFSLPTSDGFYLLVQILYVMSALFSYPVQLFPALKIMEDSKLLRFRLFDEKGRTKNKLLRYGLRLTVMFFIYLIAYTAQSFHLFVNLLGSCVFTFLGFVLPVWMYFIQFKGRMTKKLRIWNYFILVVGIILGTLGFIISLKRLFTGEHK